MSTLSASLLRLKLLDALRSGETAKVDTVMAELAATPNTTQTHDVTLLKETVLHYAVQVAPANVLAYLVTNAARFHIDINAQNEDGNTPLHIAAQASRGDVVKYLLALPIINDTVVNIHKQQPVELCRDPNIAQLMQFERAKFVEKSSIQLRQYFSARDFDNLESLLVSNPRASELLDINGGDPDTGNTVLHEFIKKDDVAMCEWILKHGGDPFKRDRRGKLPVDLVTKNDALKRLLKNASRNSSLMDPVINTNNAIKSGNSPSYKGYLRKWTNFASGYKLRYFVLDSFGVLSYYTNQDDTNNACRGSLNLSFAYLHLDSSEKLKFEIIGKNGIRWHLKANHPVETNRWVWTLQNAITIAKDNLKKQRQEAQASSGGATTTTIINSSSSGPNSGSSSSPTTESSFRNSLDEQPVEKKRLLHIPRRSSKHKRSTSASSINSAGSDVEDTNSIRSKNEANVTIQPPPPSNSSTTTATSPNLDKIQENKLLTPSTASVPGSTAASHTSESYVESDLENFDYDSEGDYESELDSDDEDLTKLNGDPSAKSESLSNQVSTLKGSLEVGIFSLLDLFKKVEASNSGDQTNEIYKVASVTLDTIHESFEKFNALVETRVAKVERRLERQLEVNKLWENTIHQLEDEFSKRENKLAEFEGQKKQLKKYFANGNVTQVGPVKSEGLGPGGIIGICQDIPAPEQTVLEEIFDDSDEDDEFFDAFDEEDDDDNDEPEQKLVEEPVEEKPVEAKSIKKEPEPESKKVEPSSTDSVDPKEKIGAVAGGAVAAVTGAAAAAVAGAGAVASGSTGSTDEKKPVESTKADSAPTSSDTDPAPPSYKDSSEETANLTAAQKAKFEAINNEGSFLGYDDPPRTKLSMDEDNRPKVGLWGILKSMIGKDMTKMTLPVSFNECTSLLQRLAEDIEYSHLLDQASQYDDSTLRMVYVAAFGASEYASTINRIAKPFNPLLGETFEYCRPEKKYRLLVEQVSHHPPISACSAESVNWDYYGENAVESQFRGRSFDFKHLGKMFCVVRPANGVINTKGERVDEELYSWKKVNTSVVGIIVGNPTVDNYGKMEVTNHTTGDRIVLDLKQRGWRASSAYQLAGHVVDRKGNTHWAVGGHWNSKIFGKKVTKEPSSDRRDSLIESEGVSTKLSSDPFSGSKFLVWQAAPRPKVPFNLTSFAVTLNDDNKKLVPWLAPTDTRLRPDQRAMEIGKYDLASDEKHRVEEKQRAARKKREMSNTSYKPQWFVKRKHPVTGDTFWEYNGQYWNKRKDHLLQDSGDIF
ncbi:oxysterol-binding protein homolog 1 [[Candida] anglica]|uniref:Oxysterol-binding protein homolog 1 n=1 Tax=[Candida] anglica TaxID=148631 RepID=A0ABP0EA14_9ASCO